jgi:hypothetical protein
LLDATVDVVSGVAPAVSFPVDLQVCPLIGEVAKLLLAFLFLKAIQNILRETYTVPVSRTLAKEYRTWVNSDAGSCCGK